MNTALPFRGYNSLEESLKQSILKTVSGCFRFYSNGLSFQFSHFLPHSSVLLILSNTWSRSNLLPLFLWAPPFPQSCFFSSFFSTMGLILERENSDFDSIVLTPTPSKMCFLCFQLWSFNNYIFQEEAALAASVASWASPDSHPILLTTTCLYPGLFSFSLSPECFWPPNPKPLFFPSAHVASASTCRVHSFLLDLPLLLKIQQLYKRASCTSSRPCCSVTSFLCNSEVWY